MVNRHLYKTFTYDRKIGVLTKHDFELIRCSLESYLAQICKLEIDNHNEIEQLKLLFIKLDHQIERFR